MKLKIGLAHDPAIPPLGIWSRELKARSQRGIYAPTLTVVSITTARKMEATEAPIDR